MIIIDSKITFKTLVLAGIICFALGCAAVYGWSIKQSRDYQERIDTITSNLAQARAANTSAAGRVEELESLHDVLRADLAASREQVDAILGGIGSLEGGLAEILRLNREGQSRIADIIGRPEKENK